MKYFKLIFKTLACIILFYFHTGIEAERKFEPYADDGGTVVGIAGVDFCLIAADIRLAATEQYFIRSRNTSRLFEIEDGIFLSGSGCWSDSVALAKLMKLKADRYKWDSLRSLSISSMSSLLSHTLYQRRFMPYYSFCTLAGLDSEGRGAVYKYDAIGSCERVTATCCGKAEHLIQPLLDEISDLEGDDALWEIGASGSSFESTSSSAGCMTSISLKDAQDLVLRAFRASAEREITVGDGVEIVVMQQEPSSKSEVTTRRQVRLTRIFHNLPSH